MMRKITIKISTPFPDWPLERQTPGHKCVWGNCNFFINKTIKHCDWWVVYDDILETESNNVSRNNTILITGEPTDIKRYPKKFTDQFAIVITCQRNIKHSNPIYSQQALHWMVGAYYAGNKTWQYSNFSKDYDELSKINTVKKDKIISTIISNKTITSDHKKRIKYVTNLKKILGDQFDIFGRGFKEIPDKWEAISRYKYHLVFENSRHDDYWTEKISDSFLGLSYPFYVGAPNIGEYFPQKSYSNLNFFNIESDALLINNAIENDLYSKRVRFIKESKNFVLNKYNLFPMLSDFCSNSKIGKTEQVTIRPQKQFKNIISKTITKYVFRQ